MPRLLELMREFYPGQGMKFEEEVARSAIHKALLDATLGSAYLILVDDALAGYLVLTFCFSLEFHGKFALLDELYIREVFRGHRLGRAAVEYAEGVCRKTGIKALRLEVGHENRAAQSLYNALGFHQDDRHLFTKWL